MSSNRLKYDKCAYEIDNKTNGNQYDYLIFKPKHVIDCNIAKLNEPCYTSPDIRTDLESDLYGITRFASQCPSKKYNPSETVAPLKYIPPWILEGIHYITPTGLDYLKR